MREIKFRAWVEDHAPDYGDEKESVMFYSIKANTTQMMGDRELVCCGGAKPQGVLESFLEDPRTPVMQYTGLKDRNGVEIYEGDIVKWEIPGFQPLRKKECVGEVTWGRKNKNTASWEVYQHLLEGKPYEGEYGNNLAFGLYCDVDKKEVIGNIYENPELLTN